MEFQLRSGIVLILKICTFFTVTATIQQSRYIYEQSDYYDIPLFTVRNLLAMSSSPSPQFHRGGGSPDLTPLFLSNLIVFWIWIMIPASAVTNIANN
ncbi:hypothetical protein Y032_0006g2791 [Ancylostoma ceylanicum]|uniref:Uncharacterized protein n=1 Tax=Ancylostoma ceylanicum TaxID=53326 RepID=A0A016VQ08_9BILA|nr:hypothetical protein Y032_0006g2791 [Ancylostoma ceylanicum]